jgi:DNA-directed RNA polymerase sigma subunit (sigma70/sigma32)
MTSKHDTADLDLFRLYLDEVGRHPLLTKQDEIELSQAYEQGLDAQLKLAAADPSDAARPELEQIAARGEWARRKMIESNLRLVVSIARRFSATGLPLGDLVQEGNLGLLRAVEKFDWQGLQVLHLRHLVDPPGHRQRRRRPRRPRHPPARPRG